MTQPQQPEGQSRRPQFMAYKVTTWSGKLVDEPIASSHHMARLMAFDNYGHRFPEVQTPIDLRVEVIGEEE